MKKEGLAVFLVFFGIFCGLSIVSAITCSQADFNKDGYIDGKDYTFFESNYRRTNCSDSNLWCSGTDLDKSGSVLGGDFGLFAGCYNASCQDTDFNSDGLTDRADFLILSTNYRKTGCNKENNWCNWADVDRNGAVLGGDFGIFAGCFKPSCNDADFNKDGKVDDKDYAIFERNYRKTNCSMDNNFCEGADLDLSGSVLGGDFGFFTGCYSNTSAQTCTDSDANLGVSPETIKGRVTLGSQVSEDVCESDKILKEYYCASTGSVSSERVSCSVTSYKCEDGACLVTKDKERGPELSNSVKANLTILKENALKQGKTWALNLNEGYSAYLSDYLVVYSPLKSDKATILRVEDISQDTTSRYSVTLSDALTGESQKINVQNDNGVYSKQFNSFGGSYYLSANLAGSNIRAWTISLTWGDEAGFGSLGKEKDTFNDLRSVQQGCSDSDGGKNYYVKGTACLGSCNTDACCSDGGCIKPDIDLLEYYCKDNLMYQEGFKCPTGCSDGACIKTNITSTQDCGLIQDSSELQVCCENWAILMLNITSDNMGCPGKWEFGDTGQCYWKCEEVAGNISHCNKDEDCPPLNCLVAPCPQMGCVDNKCVSSAEIRECNVDLDCHNRLAIECESSDEECIAKYTVECANNKCVNPYFCENIGLRKSGKYCSSDNLWRTQLKSDMACENNFECSSNVCIGGNCISEGFIQKIINWFKRLFGVEEKPTYSCPTEKTVDCMPGSATLSDPYCQTRYRTWIEKNCDINITE